MSPTEPRRRRVWAKRDALPIDRKRAERIRVRLRAGERVSEADWYFWCTLKRFDRRTRAARRAALDHAGQPRLLFGLNTAPR